MPNKVIYIISFHKSDFELRKQKCTMAKIPMCIKRTKKLFLYIIIELQSKRFMRALTSKLQVETSKKKFEIFLETFILKFCLFSKFGVIRWFTKQSAKFVKREFQGRSEKFYEVQGWSFKV